MLPQDNRNCWYVLNEREKQLVRQLDFDFLAKYGKDPALEKNLYYFLGDRYEFCRTWSAPSGALPTFRKNTGRYLNRGTMELLLGSEKLMALGWPCTPEISERLGTTTLQPIPLKQIDVMAGNAMHLTVASIVLMLGLTCHGPV